jgi:hypothetical protein
VGLVVHGLAERTRGRGDGGEGRTIEATASGREERWVEILKGARRRAKRRARDRPARRRRERRTLPPPRARSPARESSDSVSYSLSPIGDRAWIAGRAVSFTSQVPNPRAGG